MTPQTLRPIWGYSVRSQEIHRKNEKLLLMTLKVLFVCVEALRPSQQFFSHVGTDLAGYYQYFLGGKCILLKDTTRLPE